MSNVKIVGINYLHRHERAEEVLNVGSDHVIIDIEDWKEVVDYFRNNPDEVKKLGEPKSILQPEHNKQSYNNGKKY